VLSRFLPYDHFVELEVKDGKLLIDGKEVSKGIVDKKI